MVAWQWVKELGKRFQDMKDGMVLNAPVDDVSDESSPSPIAKQPSFHLS